MSDRVCYIRRTDRGAALRGLRLLGGHTDDTWQAGTSNDPSLIGESVGEGARWIKDRLGANGKSRTLAVLCLDTNGAVCSWVKPEDADASLIDDAIAGNADEHDPDSLEPETHSGLGERFPQLPLELNFEFLDEDQTSNGSRAAVMASPDVPGRLIKDELDVMGIRIGCITSIWHAIAHVWDPGAGNPMHSAQRIVSSDTPIAAAIVLDADADRLVWTWSRQGRLITGGSARIQTTRTEHETEPVVRKEDIARLCADWLGWSSQLGVAPSRIVFVGNPTQVESPTPSDSEEEQATPRYRGLNAGEIGIALSQAWSDATIDLIEHNDPIGETLGKVAQGPRDGLGSLEAITDRPGRAHRSMYRWAGVSLVAVAAVVGIFAYQLVSQAGQIKNKTSAIQIQRMTIIDKFDPQLITSQLPVLDLQNKLAQMRKSQGPLRIARSKPILEELETVSYLFGFPGIEIDSIKLNNATVMVTVRVDDIAQAEQINQNLASIKGSHLRWRTMTYKPQGVKIVASFPASWINEEDGS